MHRTTINIPDEVWRRVSNLRFDHRFRSVSETLMVLVKTGLDHLDEIPMCEDKRRKDIA